MLQQVFRSAKWCCQCQQAGLSFRVMKIVPSPICFIPHSYGPRRLVEIPTFALPRLLAAIVMVSTSRHRSLLRGGYLERQFPLNIWWYAPRIWPYPIYCSRIWPSGGIPWTFGKPDLQTKRCIHFWNDPLDIIGWWAWDMMIPSMFFLAANKKKHQTSSKTGVWSPLLDPILPWSARFFMQGLQFGLLIGSDPGAWNDLQEMVIVSGNMTAWQCSLFCQLFLYIYIWWYNIIYRFIFRHLVVKLRICNCNSTFRYIYTYLFM